MAPSGVEIVNFKENKLKSWSEKYYRDEIIKAQNSFFFLNPV